LPGYSQPGKWQESVVVRTCLPLLQRAVKKEMKKEEKR
jgi:hypothetical protein